ncbi:ArsR family transcriptional regulator [bacterium]|nr:ArsR family transcriptional regulator [bacterium]
MNPAQLKPMIKQCEATAHLLKAMAHPQRLQLLCYLSERERTVTELEDLCDASQSLLSQFLQRMKSEGLVDSRREGKFVYYSISDRKVLEVIQSLHKIFCP